MKILTVVHVLDKGGTERSARVFAEGYEKLNHDSKILAMYGYGPRGDDEIKNSIEVFLNLNNTNLNLITKWQPEVIHIHSHGLKFADVELLIDSVKELNIKIIETNVFSTPSLWSDKLHCSFQLSNWCQWLYNQRGGKIYPSTIVPNPIKCDHFFPQNNNIIEKLKISYQIPKNAFVIGRIGQSNYANWSLKTIDIFDKLHFDGYTPYLFLISPPKEILNRIDKSKYKDYIIITGYLLGDECLSSTYNIMDIFLHIADVGESFGYVNAESILCGVPAITFMTPWNSNSQVEVVKNGVCGHTVHHINSAVKLIKEYMDGKRVYDKDIGIESIKKRYDYLEVCQLSLNSINNSHTIKTITTKNIINILNDSYDNPTLLTKLFIILNLKRFTKYSSGYESWNNLIRKVFNKFFLKGRR